MKTMDVKITKAVKILWIDADIEKGQEALALLEQSAQEGNPDAYYFLARCYAGSCFVNPEFNFPEDDDKVAQLLDYSIENGSALGMFAARRFGGYSPRCGSFIQEPYHSDVEVWNAVCELAEMGEMFTKYLVANAYYYGDVLEMLSIDMDAMNAEQFEAQVRQWKMVAANIYEELLDAGMTMGVGNYIDIYKSGEFVPKDEKKVAAIRRKAADKGSLHYMVVIGSDLIDSEPEAARDYLERAWSKKQWAAGFYLGKLYTYNGKLGEDLPRAKAYFEMCLSQGKEVVACNNRLGEIYYKGGQGVEIDYEKAVQCFLAAEAGDNYWSSDMLGTCYLKGLGVAVDYARAKKEFEHFPGECLSAIGLGEIYAYGLGVPVNVKKAMECWNQFPNHQRVIENKNNFKKTLFGWKRK